MAYDLDFLKKYLDNQSINCEYKNTAEIVIHFNKEYDMTIINGKDDNDSLIHFGYGWHNHDQVIFSDNRGYYIEFNYLELIEEIIKGKIYICTEFRDGNAYSRYPVHVDYYSLDKYLRNDEEIRIKKVVIEKTNA